jgi:thiamine biosynthesis lipoprotein
MTPPSHAVGEARRGATRGGIRLAVTLTLTLAACAPPPPDATPDDTLITRDVVLMGTPARLTTWDDTRPEGLERLDAMLGVLEAAERDLSTWRNDSTASRLNGWPVGRPWPATGRWCGLLGELAALQARTGGAVDPMVGRLTEAWAIHDEGRVPDAATLEAALALSGLARLTIDTGACTVIRDADATLDVGGFGKGEALDRVVEAGIEGPWLVDLGGQVTASGVPPGGGRWRVALAHPLARDAEALALAIPEGSLATSAGSERDLVVDGTRVGHIVDPRTGRPAPFTGSVTVWHARGLLADALSTALYVMGPEAGLAWATAEGLAAVYLIPDGDALRVAPTPAFAPFIDAGGPG